MGVSALESSLLIERGGAASRNATAIWFNAEW
jgi:hypothetical protein